MKVRILTSLAIAVIGIPLLIMSDYLVYTMAVGLVCMLATYESTALSGLTTKYAVSIPSYLIAFAMPLCTYFFKRSQFEYLLVSIAVLFFFSFYLFAYAVICKGAIPFSDLSVQIVMLFYISVSFTSLALLRYIPNGVYMFALVFVASWVCDTFAYFTGFFFGKHKLIEAVSPKKTVEGAIGGVVFTTLAFMLYGFIVSLLKGAPVPRYLLLALLGFALSIVAQFGDLICSLIKREKGIKDYGNILPGHGGVLDRFDSVVAVSPVLYVVCALFPPFM